MASLQKIKTLASAKNLPMKELANQLGITSIALSRIMKNGTTTVERLEEISAILGVSPAVFFEESTHASAIASGENCIAISGDGNVTIPQSVLDMLKAKDKQLADKDKIIADLVKKLK